eukprot:GFUD01125070.1.p1 GENE.GFUD01125070.1~~GFUD01125070.1.p1  ORF type:complete len:432 (-),score=144.72 GFUD01125070.1:123-1418(-)
MPSVASELPPDPNWSLVPVQHHQMIPLNMQANPINNMYRQQMEYDMELYRRQQMYKQNHFPAMPDMYSMARATMYPMPMSLIYTQEKIDVSVMQRYQHERYLQQARDMQMSDLQAEHQEERFKQEVTERERDVAKEVKEETVDKKRIVRRSSYRAVMRNGELVEDKDGYLMVTHNNMVANTVQTPADMSNTGTKDLPCNINNHRNDYYDYDPSYQPAQDTSYQPAQDTNTATNLITKVGSVQMRELTNGQPRGVDIIVSPPTKSNYVKLIPKIAPKPAHVKEVTAVLPKDEVLKEDIEQTKDVPAVVQTKLQPSSPTLPPDIRTLFPHLKTTNTGSVVLWNFLWALLKDENQKKVVTWISFTKLNFRIVSPSQLATTWGQVKQDPSMDWSKINKILDLYLRKGLISSGPAEDEFTFLIIPRSIKETLNTMK